MDNSAFIHFPVGLASRDARLFWLLALELYRAEFLSECERLIDSDWTELIENEDSEDIAAQLCALAFAKDDLSIVARVSEGFSPDRHATYFQRLREFGKATPGSKKCLAWMQSQSLLGGGFDGFKSALREGRVDLARALHQPTPAEAEAAFYDSTASLSKESLGLLVFHCPALAEAKILRHALLAKASDEALCFLAWKIEGSRSKTQLRNPGGDERALPELMAAALGAKRFALAKKLLEWDRSLAFESFKPAEIGCPWSEDGPSIKLDGSLALSPSDFACLYLQESLARSLGKLDAPAPNSAKVGALAAALGKKREARQPGAGLPWARARQAQAEALAKSIWREAKA